MEDECKQIETNLRRLFENDLPTYAERRLRVKLHQFIPDAYFAVASDECLNAFVAGHFYSCIMVCQAVAEGIAQFLAESNNVSKSDDHKALINKLQHKGIITATAYAAFRKIRGEDRNDFHHLNPTVEQGYRELEDRAEECVNALYEIESEVFALMPNQRGEAALKNPQYWRADTKSGILVYVRGR